MGRRATSPVGGAILERAGGVPCRAERRLATQQKIALTGGLWSAIDVQLCTSGKLLRFDSKRKRLRDEVHHL